MKAYIYGGGQGLRMFPFSNYAPKLLLPVWGCPIINIQLKMLEKRGINKVGVLFSKNSELQIENLASLFPNMKIDLLKIEPTHLHAWKKILSNNDEKEIIIINSDIIFSDIWLEEVINTHNNARVTFLGCDSKFISDGQEGQSVWYSLNSAGYINDYSLSVKHDCAMLNEIGISKIDVSVFNSVNLLQKLDDGVDFWYDFLVPAFLQKFDVKFITMREFWKDIGTWSRYQEIHYDILDGKISGLEYIMEEYHTLEKQVGIHISSLPNNNVKFGNRVAVFQNVKIGFGTYVTNSIIGRNVKIGANCCIKDSIILENSVIESNCIINNKIIDGRTLYDRI